MDRRFRGGTPAGEMGRGPQRPMRPQPPRPQPRASTSPAPTASGTAAKASPTEPKNDTPRVEGLRVFQLAHELAVRVHQLTRDFPREETFGLAAQLRHAAASVPASLADGASRFERGEYRHGVGDAQGSAAQASYHILLAKELGYVPANECERLRADYARVGQMLTRLAQALMQAPARS